MLTVNKKFFFNSIQLVIIVPIILLSCNTSVIKKPDFDEPCIQQVRQLQIILQKKEYELYQIDSTITEFYSYIDSLDRIIKGLTNNLIAEKEKTNYYIVKTGDTLNKIAQIFNTDWKSLWKLNPEIKNPHKIKVGLLVRIKKVD